MVKKKNIVEKAIMCFAMMVIMTVSVSHSRAAAYVSLNTYNSSSFSSSSSTYTFVDTQKVYMKGYTLTNADTRKLIITTPTTSKTYTWGSGKEIKAFIPAAELGIGPTKIQTYFYKRGRCIGSGSRTIYVYPSPVRMKKVYTSNGKTCYEYYKKNNVDGYQVAMRTNGSSSYRILATLGNNTPGFCFSTSVLLDKRIYIRAYKDVKGKRYYSSWTLADIVA